MKDCVVKNFFFLDLNLFVCRFSIVYQFPPALLSLELLLCGKCLRETTLACSVNSGDESENHIIYAVSWFGCLAYVDSLSLCPRKLWALSKPKLEISNKKKTIPASKYAFITNTNQSWLLKARCRVCNTSFSTLTSAMLV